LQKIIEEEDNFILFINNEETNLNEVDKSIIFCVSNCYGGSQIKFYQINVNDIEGENDFK